MLDVSGVQGSFGLGAMLEAVAGQLWLGASYQAQPGLGEMKLGGMVRTFYEDGRTEFPVTFHQALPDIFRLGVRWRPEPVFELRLHGDHTRWSAMQTQCVSLKDEPCAVYPNGADATAEATTVQNVRRRWNDTWGLRLGGSAYLNPGWSVRRGRLRDQGHAGRDAGARLIDADNVSVAAGGRFEVGNGFALLGTVSYVHYLPRDNTGRTCWRGRVAHPRADGGGRYTLSLTMLQLGLEKRF